MLNFFVLATILLKVKPSETLLDHSTDEEKYRPCPVPTALFSVQLKLIPIMYLNVFNKGLPNVYVSREVCQIYYLRF